MKSKIFTSMFLVTGWQPPRRSRGGWPFFPPFRLTAFTPFLLLFLPFAFCLLPCSYADYADGDGSPEFPYQIAEPNQLIYMSRHPEHWGFNFILTADINLALADPNTFTTALIAPDTDNSNYSFEGTRFTGVFDGNGHIISNMTIDDPNAGNDYLGLFGYITVIYAEVKNLGIENINIIGGNNSHYLGSLCGYNNYGTISNCYTNGSVIGGNNSRVLGGPCGYNREGTITNCYATGSVISGAGSIYLGGLCGENRSGGVIDNCYSTGSVTGGVGSYYLGGLCGENYGSIRKCYFLDTAGPDNGYGTPLDDPNMRIQSSFFNWDFVGEEDNGTDDHWQMCIDSHDYPCLAWQFINPADFLLPGRVDNYDLFVLTHDWLTDNSRCCDISPAPTPDGIVNILDFTELSRHWLEVKE